jgi:simple sugar transport system substrate-binding protein
MFKLTQLFSVIFLVFGIVLVSLGTTDAQDNHLAFAMVSHGGADIPFWHPVIQGMEDACALLEAECHWLSNPFFSFEEMEGYWDDALALNPDGIGTSAIDPIFVRAGVERAAELGIPVIIFNADDPNVGTSEALPTLFYVGVDEFGAGASNARRVFTEADADGVTIQRGVCANNLMSISSIDARCAGVESVFEEEGIPLDHLSLNNDNSETVAMLTDYFAEHPETNAILFPGQGSAQDLPRYMRQVGLEPGQLYSATHDITSEVLQMIRDGYMLQTVGQQPYMQGFQTIMSLYLASQYGIQPSGNIYTNTIVDQNNVDQVFSEF